MEVISTYCFVANHQNSNSTLVEIDEYKFFRGLYRGIFGGMFLTTLKCVNCVVFEYVQFPKKAFQYAKKNTVVLWT